MKSIANIIHNKNFPLIIVDNDGNEIYREYSVGCWFKQEFDYNNNADYYENSYGYIEDKR